jgi:hypothetical protein
MIWKAGKSKICRLETWRRINVAAGMQKQVPGRFPLLGEGQSFSLCPKVFCWLTVAHSHVNMLYSKRNNLNANLIFKISSQHHPDICGQILGYQGLAKLTYETNHHTWTLIMSFTYYSVYLLWQNEKTRNCKLFLNVIRCKALSFLKWNIMFWMTNKHTFGPIHKSPSLSVIASSQNHNLFLSACVQS